MSENITIEQRRELCSAAVTLDGEPARITGAALPFAKVSTATNGGYEWAWPTVARIVANGGAFKS